LPESFQGIGAAVAIALAKEGANVVVNYVSPSSKAQAEQVVKTIEDLGVQALLVQADMASIDDINSLVEDTVGKFGKIDILVNNAGVGSLVAIGEIVSVLFEVPTSRANWNDLILL
jgi:3-oxoacyl-[acyl-carrier protein] reductase